MLHERRTTTDVARKRELSKLIRNYVRKNLRRKKSERMSKLLDEFQDLQRMGNIRNLPILRQKRKPAEESISPDAFGFFPCIYI